MEESPYSNRQIELLLDKQSADLKSHMDSSLNPILKQTTATNGRVTKLEDKVEKNSSDLNRIKFYFKIVMFVITFITTALVGVVSNFIHL